MLVEITSYSSFKKTKKNKSSNKQTNKQNKHQISFTQESLAQAHFRLIHPSYLAAKIYGLDDDEFHAGVHEREDDDSCFSDANVFVLFLKWKSFQT